MYMYIILHLASSYFIRAYEMNKGTIFYKNAVGSKLSGNMTLTLRVQGFC